MKAIEFLIILLFIGIFITGILIGKEIYEKDDPQLNNTIIDYDFYPIAGYVDTVRVNAGTVIIENPNATVIIVAPEGQYIVEKIK